jgi:hypothetical protein
MSTKTRPAKRPDGTIPALASALRVSHRRVSAMLKQGCPDDPQAALEWREARENDDSVVELRRRKIAVLTQQERLAKIKADEADGLLVSRAECREAWTKLATALGRALQMAAREIPNACLGLPISKSLPKAKEKMNAIQTMLSDGESEFWLAHPETRKPQENQLPKN